MGKKSTPKAPDLTSLSNAQLQISQEQLQQAREQMNMSQAQFDRFMQQTQDEMAQSQKQYEAQMGLQSRALDQADAANAVSKAVADKQIAAMDQNMQYAAEDRQRYKDVALPMQDKYIADAKAYDTPERRQQAAAQALADNQTQLEAQRQSVAANLASMGVDPSQVMSTSLSNQMGVAGAAMGAMNANNAALQVESTGRNLVENSINMLNGLPAQSNASANTAVNAGNSAAGNINSSTSNYNSASGIGATASGIRQNSLNTAASITGSPMAWASLGNQSYGGASNGIMNSSSIQNQMFQNQMSAAQLKQQQSASTMQAIGSVASIAGMAMMAEGGTVGEDGLPAIDYGGGGAMQYSVPSDYRVDDMRPSHATSVRTQPVPQGNPYGTALYMAGQDLQRTQAPPHDPNMSHNWLPPVYRAEGGAMGSPHVVPNVQSRDKILTAVSPGEIVIPADVARIKGQEFFDRLIQKHHRPGA